uniref:HTH cro/C1-type domain-containing protein n=1 Tax=Dunaliella tertiolecta TaxID=3047 RepID=A0A7S3RAG9_DUNTE|mmetsp:Transcript_1120/g.2628  ORF Transcript_1120/g.2628 Transcript_1120/m.2628 type:complete len:138 (+) Transcript_1120:111-524(+)
MMQGQDFQDVVIRKKAPKQSDLKDAAAVNAARRAGHQIETAQKFGAGSNKHAPTTVAGKSAAKLEQETEDFHHERVSSTLKTQIVKARTAKKLTQAQLAQAINEKPQVIQEYESGKAIPNPQVLSKLSRILGVQLKK